VNLFVFIIRIYHNARSTERQKKKYITVFTVSKWSKSVMTPDAV